ncbi:MAG: hypothetical protein R2728_06370 [Chitinophagales bacterium]
MSELNNAIKDGKFSIDEDELDKAIDLSEDLLNKAWKELLEQEDLPSNFISHARPLCQNLLMITPLF